jgi:hypothetical protein
MSSWLQCESLAIAATTKIKKLNALIGGQMSRFRMNTLNALACTGPLHVVVEPSAVSHH